MKEEKDKLIFSTGREVYANNLIVGIDDEGGITEGYDGGIPTDEWFGKDALTPSEIVELCDHMIARWQKKKAETTP